MSIFPFCTIICWKNSKLAHLGPIGRHPHLFQMTHIVEPQIHELAIFFIKMTSFKLDFVPFLRTFKIAPNCDDWQTPPFVQNSQHCGAPSIWVQIFWHKINPLSISILFRKLLKNFKIGPFWADWPTPFLSKIMWISKNIIAQIRKIRRGAWNLPEKIHLFYIFCKINKNCLGADLYTDLFDNPLVIKSGKIKVEFWSSFNVSLKIKPVHIKDQCNW